MFTLRFAFKNVISRKSSLVIVLFISFSLAVFVMANAVFDGTGTGIEKTFSSNFTGDIVIRPKAAFPMSLFGDETPATGSLSELPQLVPYPELLEELNNTSEITSLVSQITSQAALYVAGASVPAFFFGVPGESYVKVMNGIKVLEGAPYADSEKGLMLSSKMYERLCNASEHKIKIGENVQLAYTNGASFSLRAAPLSAIYEYTIQNDLQDRIVLISPETLRSLVKLESFSVNADIETENTFLIDSFDSVDDMFGDSAELLFEDEPVSEPVIEKTVKVNNADEITESSWHYIICSVNKNASAKAVIHHLNKTFSKKEWNVQAISWRAAAGMSAQYLYWIRLIFNVGLIILIGTGFIVVNNTLVISAMDRTKETGALRALGASRNFVALEYFLETAMLTITSGIIGCALGAFGNQMLCVSNISFHNTYLVQLFGGTTLKTVVTFTNVCTSMALSALFAIVGWFYPVHIALETSPVMAMEAAR